MLRFSYGMAMETFYGTFVLFSGKNRPIFVASYLMMAIVNFNVQRLYRHLRMCVTTLLVSDMSDSTFGNYFR